VAAAVVGAACGFVATASFASGEAVYVVQPGDTLWSIATEDGLTVEQLATANGLDPSGVLLAGAVLHIPPASGPGDAVAAVSAGEGATGEADQAGGSTVADGPWCDPSRAAPFGVVPAELEVTGALALRPVFEQWARADGVSPALVEAIAWQESGWQQGVVSPAGAVGIGQLLPATAAFVNDDLLVRRLDPYSVTGNIALMTRFVAYLAAEEQGNLCATIAAYYEGPTELQAFGVLPSARQYVADVESLLIRFE